MEDKARLEKLVEAEASKPRWKRRVDSVRCPKGIDVTERRGPGLEVASLQVQEREVVRAWLAHALRALQWESVRQGGITKAGNKH